VRDVNIALYTLHLVENVSQNHRFWATALLFVSVNLCIYLASGSIVNQRSLSEKLDMDFPPCRAADEYILDMFGAGRGRLIFDAVPTEEFYLELDSIPRPKGHKYSFCLSFEGKEYFGMTIIKGDSIATYSYF
jgi:hypothetical protein